MSTVSKAQQQAVQRYVKKSYDRIMFNVPKGQRAMIQSAAKERGESVNAFITRAVLARMGLSQWPELEADSD